MFILYKEENINLEVKELEVTIFTTPPVLTNDLPCYKLRREPVVPEDPLNKLSASGMQKQGMF